MSGVGGGALTVPDAGLTSTTLSGCTRMWTITLPPGVNAMPLVARQIWMVPCGVFTTSLPAGSTTLTVPATCISSAGPFATTVDGPSTSTTGSALGGASVP